MSMWYHHFNNFLSVNKEFEIEYVAPNKLTFYSISTIYVSSAYTVNTHGPRRSPKQQLRKIWWNSLSYIKILKNSIQ